MKKSLRMSKFIQLGLAVLCVVVCSIESRAQDVVLSAADTASATLVEIDEASDKVKRVPMLPLADDALLDPTALEAAITKGVDFLIKDQNSNGSWGSVTKTKGINIYAPMPGAHHAFRMGTSCLALTGLLESADQRPAVQESIARAEKWILKELPRLRRADVTTTYNVWGHAYALKALAALAKRDGVTEEQKKLYIKTARSQIDALVMYQDIDGGWGYYSRFATSRPSGGSMSFTTAAVLTAVYDCHEVLGVSLPEKRRKLGVKAIQMQSNPDFTYNYAFSHRVAPRYRINRPGGSLARSQSCNVALRLYGDEKVTDAVLTSWLDKLVKRNGWLDIGRKRPVPHETHFAVSGYFYYFGHYYAARCIEMIPADQQNEWKNKLGLIILDKQESDGSWWDFPLYDYHQPYGTGFVLSTLSRCRK